MSLRKAKIEAAIKIQNIFETKNIKSNKSKMTQTSNINLDSLLNTLPNFEGKQNEDIIFFINQFTEIAEAIKLTNELKVVLLKAKIAGAAKNTLMNIPEIKNEKDFATLVNKLQEEFKTKTNFTQAQNEFMTAAQKQGESVEEFSKKFNSAAQKYLTHSGQAEKEGAKQLLKVIKLTRFLEGLRPDIAFEVNKQGPNTYEEAFEIAKKIELAFNNVKHEINHTFTENKSEIYKALITFSNEQTEKINEMQQQLNNLQLNKEKKITEKEKYCHICEKNNHDTSNCYFNAKTNKKNNFLAPRAPIPVRPRQQFKYDTRNYWQRNFQRFTTPNTRPFNSIPYNTWQQIPQTQDFNYISQNFPVMEQTPAIQYSNQQQTPSSTNQQNFANPQPIVSFPSETNQQNQRKRYFPNRGRAHNKHLN